MQVGSDVAASWHQEPMGGFRSFADALQEIKNPTAAYTVLLPPAEDFETLRSAWKDDVISAADVLHVLLRHIIVGNFRPSSLPQPTDENWYVPDP